MMLLIGLTSCVNDTSQNTGIHPSTKTSSSPLTSTKTTTTIPTNIKPTITQQISPIFLPPDMSGRITEMLKLLPGNPGVSHDQVWFIDFYAWDATLGININGYKDQSSLTPIENEVSYINDLIFSTMEGDRLRMRSNWFPWLGQPPFISGMGKGIYTSYYGYGFTNANPIREKMIGFGPLEVERSILSATIDQESPGNYEAIKGDFDATAISRSFDQYEEDYQRPQVSSSDGIDIYSWDSSGYSQQRSLMPPVFDFSGRGHTLAVIPDYIFGSQQPGRIDEMIDSSQSRTPSLADDHRYQVLADKLETMGNMSAIMSVDKILKSDNWPGKSPLFTKAAQSAPLMGPYAAFGAGLSVDDKGLFVSLVLLYDSPYLAEKDIEVLKERLRYGTNNQNSPWAIEVDDSEIWADGNVLCARLYGNVTNYWDCFVYQEPLLVRGN
jgi:hypothetical protein